MANDKNKYTIPQDSHPTMASEPAVAYLSPSAPDTIILPIPQGVDAEQLREKVNIYYDTLLKEMLREQLFRHTLNQWLEQTGMYSGPNLCWDNEPFRQIQSMGPGVITMIDRATDTLPQYTHRHLGWLKRKLQEI